MPKPALSCAWTWKADPCIICSSHLSHARCAPDAATEGATALSLDSNGATRGNCPGDSRGRRQRARGESRTGRAGGRDQRAVELGAQRAAGLNAVERADLERVRCRGGVLFARRRRDARRGGDSGRRASEGAVARVVRAWARENGDVVGN